MMRNRGELTEQMNAHSIRAIYITLHQRLRRSISVSISALPLLKQVLCGVMKGFTALSVIPLGACMYTECLSYRGRPLLV